jgi:hypothetical protein
MSEVAEFRSDVSAWIAENCPQGAKGPGQLANGSTKIELEPDVALWLERCAEKGFTAPYVAHRIWRRWVIPGAG